MPAAMLLDDETCPACGAADLYWWSKRETATATEVYVTCDGCGREFPKRVVEPSANTEAVAREVVR